MADARLGLGTLVKYDHDNDASYTTIGEISAVDPPPREYEAVDATDLADTLAVNLQGQEINSIWSFTQIWTDGDTVHEYIDSAFDSKHNYSWQLVLAADSGGAHLAVHVASDGNRPGDDRRCQRLFSRHHIATYQRHHAELTTWRNSLTWISPESVPHGLPGCSRGSSTGSSLS